MSNDKISTEGGPGLGHNPFGALSSTGLPAAKIVAGPVAPGKPGSASPATNKNRGRVDIRRETGGRGGKTVTVADGFVGIGQLEKEQLTKKMRAACGCGGTVKDGAIVIQGDQRETMARILSEAGFRPVMAGG
jgi:translation initiation factor 1